MELYLIKHGRTLTAEDQLGEDALSKIKPGTRVKCVITRQQNSAFHRKLMALFNVGFRYWEPGEIDCKYGAPEKNFERFRKDVTIMAGFYEIHTRLDGSFRVVAKSLSYGSMSPEEREDLYSAVINVLLQRIFVGYTEEAVIKMAEQEILGFA